MDGKTNDEWLVRKERTVLAIKHATILLCYDEENEEYATYRNNREYVCCGGGFPSVVNNEFHGAICVSGLTHEEDHELLTCTLHDYLEEHYV